MVVTGLGLVTPIGTGVELTWKRLLDGRSGITPIEKFDVSDIPAKVAAQVVRGAGEGEFNYDDWVSPKERRKMADFIMFGLAAAQQAIEDANWRPETEDQRYRTGVLIGSGIGGLNEIVEGSETLR